MGKGLRAKSLRRYRSAKRQVVYELPRIREVSKKLKLIKSGVDITPKPKKNRFLYPGMIGFSDLNAADDPEAEVPQRRPVPALDLRSESVPLSGLAGAYNRRKYDPQELQTSSFLAKAAKHLAPHGALAMDIDEQATKVASSQRVGNFKSGKSAKYASKKLEKIKKNKK